MATIKDVAQLAGVSPGTISRYINGFHVKDKNREQIEYAINKLNFKPNMNARTLRTNRTRTIGVIIPGYSDIYSMTIVKNIEQKLYESGYYIFLCDSWGNAELERDKVRLLLDKMVDGLIIYPCSGDISYFNQLNIHNIPVVTLDLSVKNFLCDQILTDNINATYNAVEWLVKNNHRRIGIISSTPDNFTSSERLKGYERVHEDYGLVIDSRLVKTLGYDINSGYQSLVELMQSDASPTAVITCNYHTTLGAFKAIRDFKIQIPEKLSIIGFDNIGLSDVLSPPVSIISQPMNTIGINAAELILKRINGDYSDFPSIMRLKTDLILQESTRRLD